MNLFNIEKMLNRLSSEKGFSLIEGLVALGVVSAVALALSTFVANVNKNFNAMEAIGTRGQLEALIRSGLSNYDMVDKSSTKWSPNWNEMARHCMNVDDGKTCLAGNSEYTFQLYTMDGFRLTGKDLLTAVPFTAKGASVMSNGKKCGAWHSQQCPIVAWTTAKPVCALGAASCDQAAYIEFTYRIEQGDPKYRIKGLGSQSLQALSGTVVLDMSLSPSKPETRCPLGNPEIGRDKLGRSYCSPKCQAGFVGTGGQIRDPAGEAINQCVARNTENCPPRTIFRGYDIRSRPICVAGCADGYLQTGWIGNRPRCQQLGGEDMRCPVGQIQSGF